MAEDDHPHNCQNVLPDPSGKTFMQHRSCWLPGLVLMLAVSACSPVEKAEPEEDPQPAELEVETVPVPGDPSGVWSTHDDQGKPFDVVLFENGQVVTTWVQSTGGARGERGFWRSLGDRVAIFLDDGRTMALTAGEGSLQFETMPPASRTPSHIGKAKRLEEPEAQFVGSWRLNREPDGSYLYLTLQSNGSVFSTVNGLTEGRWEMKNDAAVCSWPDGWIDQIERAAGGWHKKSWVGGADGPPADLSAATRVGETRFVISP